jgi:hypothetical protein
VLTFSRIAAALVVLAAAPAVADEYRLLEIDGATVKWGAPVLGQGSEVSYGFATVAAQFDDAINCRRLAPMTALAPAWGGDPARLEAVAAAAFAIWSRAADVDFRRASPGETPDILIGTQGTPEHVAFANVWRGTAERGLAPLTRATICLNPEIAWTTTEPAPPGALDLGTVLAHEIGHAIGLDHPGADGALMGYSNQGDIDALMPGDIAGAVTLYGRREAE